MTKIEKEYVHARREWQERERVLEWAVGEERIARRRFTEAKQALRTEQLEFNEPLVRLAAL